LHQVGRTYFSGRQLLTETGDGFKIKTHGK
jgi:hypothetical protein